MKGLFYRKDRTVRSGWKIFAFVISFLGAAAIIAGFFPGDPEKYRSLETIDWKIILFEFMSVAFPLFLFTYIFEIYWNKVDWKNFHLSFAKGWLKELGIGLLLGIAAVTFILFIYAVFGFSHISLNFTSFSGALKIIWDPILLFFALMALVEELMLRGYIYRELTTGTNKYISTIVLSALFALVHLGNKDVNLLASINIFLVGIVFAITVLYTNRLWLAWGMHFGWNYFMGVIYSFNVSGYAIDGLVKNEVSGPKILSGAGFGPEGSLIGTITVIILGIVTWKILHNHYEIDENLDNEAEYLKLEEEKEESQEKDEEISEEEND